MPAPHFYPSLAALDPRLTPAVVALPTPAGSAPVVVVADTSAGVVSRVAAFESAFAGGVSAAAADLTGDGTPDVIAAAGPGGGPRVVVIDGATRETVASFFAYAVSFSGGVSVAAADVTGDGVADIVTGAGAGGGPHVKVFDGRTRAEARGFFAFEPSSSGGVSVAAADLDGDGRAEVAAGAGANGGPRVRVFDGGTGEVTQDYFAFAPDSRAGVRIAVTDRAGAGLPNLVCAPDVYDASAAPPVSLFDGRTGAKLAEADPARAGEVLQQIRNDLQLLPSQAVKNVFQELIAARDNTVQTATAITTAIGVQTAAAGVAEQVNQELDSTYQAVQQIQSLMKSLLP